MKWKIIAAVIILVVPALIWSRLCGLLMRYGEKGMKEADENLKRIEPRRVFPAKISHRELINVWTVLMLTPQDGSAGFYLKTANRTLKEGDTVEIAEMEELTDLAELLRSAQVRADDEHGHFIFSEDWQRLAGKLRAQRRESETLYAFGETLKARGLVLILPVCVLIAVILTVWAFR